VNKIEECFLAPVGAALLCNDTQVIARDGWYQTITPSTGTTQGNEVVWSRLAPEDVDRVIGETIAQYAVHRVPFRWTVGPLTEPADFGGALERHGFATYPVRGMSLGPSAWVAKPRPGITVERVTEATLPTYYEAFERGWDTVAPDPAAWCADHGRAMATGRFFFYLARVDGELAGSAGFVTKPRCAYLIGGNVLAPYQKRGVYRALLDARLADIAAHGSPLAVTQAREATAAPILEALGFETLYRSNTYRWHPK